MGGETWLWVDGFDNYVVSDRGEIQNTKFQRTLNPTKTPGGYLRVNLRQDGVTRQCYVHQVVAAAFIPDYRPGCRVKHRNERRDDNRVSNLQLMGGVGEPPIHYDSPRLHARRLRVVETGMVFRTAYDCARHIGGQASNIYQVLNGKRATHLGYTFEYINIEE